MTTPRLTINQYIAEVNENLSIYYDPKFNSYKAMIIDTESKYKAIIDLMSKDISVYIKLCMTYTEWLLISNTIYETWNKYKLSDLPNIPNSPELPNLHFSQGFYYCPNIPDSLQTPKVPK